MCFRFSWLAMFLSLCLAFSVKAQSLITVGDNEQGLQRTGQQLVLHDESNRLSIDDVSALLANEQFVPLLSQGSTGLKKGAYWSSFTLKNTLSKPITLYLEYVDHQLIHKDTFERASVSDRFTLVHSLSMTKPFEHRKVRHHRFVTPIQLMAKEQKQVLVRFGSDEAGFTYPSMRIWSPKNFHEVQAAEAGLTAFLFGGFLLMSLFALVSGLASNQSIFFYYSLYSFSKITCWATILGYTHQYMIRDNFHWSLMSISGAITIICGILFARAFLQSRQYIRRIDYLLLLMLTNASLLLIGAIFQIKVLALVTITLALLFYPVMIWAGVIRWRQGSTEAGVFSIAWSFLVVGLIVQALRDLGLVEHNYVNYYWPPVASFIEMLTIMFAIGLKVRRMRQEKIKTQRAYNQHLETSKLQLEREVKLRTQELEAAKQQAELRASTDSLTGISNRRSFMERAKERIVLAQRQQQPCCLFMIDLDNFKKINDNMGHSAGDAALVQFTRLVENAIRESDVFGRLGGEEFALLMTENLASAQVIGERLRREVAENIVAYEANQFHISVSMGLTEIAADGDLELALKRSDAAMYQAKASGRNQLVVANEDVE